MTGSTEPNAGLRSLAARLRGEVPDRVADLFVDYLEHNEPVLALETLFDELDDARLTVPRWLADELAAAGEDYGTTRFTAAEVRALARPD